MKNKVKLGCAGLIFSTLALLFCFMGLVQAAWLSATPNFPLERTQRNLRIWGVGTVLSFVMLCAFIFIYYRAKRKYR